MLADKIEYYKTTGKMLNNIPAQYKKEYPWLKEVDSLTLANAQLNLNKAYKNFFKEGRRFLPNLKKLGSPRLNFDETEEKPRFFYLFTNTME